MPDPVPDTNDVAYTMVNTVAEAKVACPRWLPNVVTDHIYMATVAVGHTPATHLPSLGSGYPRRQGVPASWLPNVVHVSPNRR